jgi:hypothetical protein
MLVLWTRSSGVTFHQNPTQDYLAKRAWCFRNAFFILRMRKKVKNLGLRVGLVAYVGLYFWGGWCYVGLNVVKAAV